MTEIIPGILETSFSEIKRKIDLVKDLTDWVHIDILDDTLFPNRSYLNFEAFALFRDQIHLEAHLQVADPVRYLVPLVRNGFGRIISMVEANSARNFIEETRKWEVEVGLGLNAPSPLELIEPFLGEIDVALVMTVNAGFSGQVFQSEQLSKIQKISGEYPDLPLECDGGINSTTGAAAVKNGATRLTANSFLFDAPERLEERLETLRHVV